MRHVFALLFSVLIALPAFAGQPESENALTNILFDEDMENVSFSLRGNGFVDILFGIAVPENDYVRIVGRLRNHPDIPGVLAGRGTANFCKVP